uniref:Zinc finger, CCHC-type n=1 Tax=Tanacetum cinerariifolium TaxID=118510 RepID=A0A6L2K0R2_TANCI|nr:zinc finger, CCHC-type [Tanacetum cinerariifolium]
METILKAYGIWETIVVKEGVTTNEKKENTSKAIIFQTLPQDVLMQVAQYSTAKEVWDSIKVKHLGADLVQKARLQTLRSALETLRIKPNEKVSDFGGKLSSIMAKFKGLGETLEDKEYLQESSEFVKGEYDKAKTAKFAAGCQRCSHVIRRKWRKTQQNVQNKWHTTTMKKRNMRPSRMEKESAYEKAGQGASILKDAGFTGIIVGYGAYAKGRKRSIIAGISCDMILELTVLDALIKLFFRTNISTETLWDGGWLLRQLLPYSDTEFTTHQLQSLKITTTKVKITGRNKDDLPGYKNDHKHYKKSDGGFNQKMDQEDLKTYTAAFVIRGENVGQNPITQINPKPAGKPNRGQTGQTGQSPTQLSNDS